MVLADEVGAKHPVIMDFGLARDAGEGMGLTESGAVLGTPAYMAPEQARGDTRSLDRRSDVYSLGATLYHLLCGTPPFVAESLVALLFLVINDEPPRPKKSQPALPADLETIVLKCLQKEPEQRYESARALAADLRRFMDGDPIQGRRVSVFYRLRRIGQRHKSILALGTAAILGIGVATGYGLQIKRQANRQQQQAAREAELGMRLAQEVKELEWLMRAAYTLPLHDVRAEREKVQQRMAALEQRLRSAGTTEKHWAQWALGRGALAVHDPELARRYLQDALDLGPRYPQIYYALGVSLIQIYQTAMEQARHSGNPSWLVKRQAELSAELLRPALDYLEKSRNAPTLESPAYLTGLLAFYRQDYPQALAQAQHAITELPWLYEAHKLQGDVYLELGNQKKERGENLQAAEHFDQALLAYQQAAEIGRSDAALYEAMAEVLIRSMELDFREGRSPAAKLPRALAVCEQAIAAAPERSTGYTQKSFAYFFTNLYFTNAKKDQVEMWRQQREAAERAIAINPKDFFALESLAATYRNQASAPLDTKQDSTAATRTAIAYMTRAVELDPKSPWGVNDLAGYYTRLAKEQQSSGADPTDSYAHAESLFRRAVAMDPAYNYAFAGMISLNTNQLRYATWTGRSADDFMARAMTNSEACLARNPHESSCIKTSIWAKVSYARYQLERDEDPRSTIQQAYGMMAKYSRTLAGEPHDAASDRADLVLVEFEYAIKTGRATVAIHEKLFAAINDCVKAALPGVAACGEYVLHAALLRAREQLLHGELTPAQHTLREKIPVAAEFIKQAPLNPKAHWLRAELFLRLAEVLQSLRKPIAAELEAGLAAAQNGLTINPRFAYTLAAQGALQTLRAQHKKDPEARRSFAQQAAATLQRAFAINAFVKPRYESYQRAVSNLSQFR